MKLTQGRCESLIKMEKLFHLVDVVNVFDLSFECVSQSFIQKIFPRFSSCLEQQKIWQTDLRSIERFVETVRPNLHCFKARAQIGDSVTNYRAHDQAE